MITDAGCTSISARLRQQHAATCRRNVRSDATSLRSARTGLRAPSRSVALSCARPRNHEDHVPNADPTQTIPTSAAVSSALVIAASTPASPAAIPT